MSDIYTEETPETLIESLIKQSQLYPDFIIFTFFEPEKENQTITYQELDQRARAIAAELQQKYSVGDRIIIIFPPGIEFITAFYGCLYAGLIAVPVYPPTQLMLVEKIQHILDDTTPSAILSTQKIINIYKKMNWIKKTGLIHLIKYFSKKKWQQLHDYMEWDFEKYTWIAIDKIKNDKSREWKYPHIQKTNLALLQYTSGSTGNPKGVMLSHENLINNIIHITRNSNLNENSSGISWLPPYHDMGLIGVILTSAFSKVHSYLMSPLTFLRNPFIWLKLISDYRAEITVAPNFAFELCCKKITETEKELLDLSCLKLCLNGAEPINKKTLNKFNETFKSTGLQPTTITPTYGLAEATLMASCKEFGKKYNSLNLSKEELRKNKIKILTNESENIYKIVSCGKIIYPTKIVNPHTHEEYPEDCLGEIWLTGPSIAQGYWNKPEETQHIFHAKIKNDKSRTHYLRTGDLGFIHAGELYITGRIKDLIIINGRNYYPQDIENTLSNTHPAIRTGCCAAFSYSDGDIENLVVVCEIDPNKLKESENYESLSQDIINNIALHHELVTYDIVFIPIKTLPKTTSGKIKRAHTKHLYFDNKLSNYFTKTKHHTISTKESTKLDDIEQKIMNIIKKSFEKENINLDDNFFSVGGDSIIAGQIIMEIENIFGVKINFELFFDNPTFKEIMNFIKKNQLKIPQKLLINKQNIKHEAIPLSYSQEQLWLFQKLHPTLASYNLPIEIQLKGKLDLSLLETAINGVINKHAILRSFFVEIDNMPYQKISTSIPFKLSVISLNQLSKSQRIKEMTEIFNKESYQVIDLGQPPLFRIKLIKIRKNEFNLFITIPHIIADGRSIKYFLRDLSDIYNNATIKLNEFEYSDYCFWQRTNDNSKDLIYWKKEFNVLPEQLNLPYRNSHQHMITYQANSILIKVDKKLYQLIAEFANQHKATLYMIFLTAYFILLHRYTHQKDILIGTPISGRNRHEFEELIGYFVTVLPLRTSIDPYNSFLQILDQVKKQTTDAFSHPVIPYDQIDQLPIIQTMLVWQDKFDPTFALAKVDAKVIPHSVMAKYEIIIEVNRTSQAMTLRFEYATELFTEKIIQNLADNLINLIKNLISQPTMAINKLQFISKEELKLLNKFGKGALLKKPLPLIHEYLESTAKKSPHKTAIIDHETEINYRELNLRANMLANFLFSLKLPQPTIIGILLPRSIDFIVVLIAILKSGHVCLPLDINFPTERIQLMLQVSKTAIILTHSKVDLNLNDQSNLKLIAIDTLNKNNKKPFPKLHINKDQPAFVIFTSGSTGKPKGVLLTHAGISSRIWWSKNNIPLSENDRFLHQFSFNFDAALSSLFWPLSCAATIILPTAEQLSDLYALKNLILQYQITVLSSIPSIYTELLELFSEHDSHIHTFISGGEVFTSDLARKIKSFNPTNIINLYGPTECSIFSTYYQIEKIYHNRIPIGRPINETMALILDEFQNQVPLGSTGEICLGGQGIALGYLNSKEMTDQYFIPNPQKKLKYNKIYRTGDLGKFDLQGNIHYRGRIDFQIKVSGHRIEPEEIERFLLLHPNIKEAAITTSKINEKSASLLAFVVCRNEMLNSDELRNFLFQHLPHYLIPANILPVSALPKLPNGKLDRNELKNLIFLSKQNDFKLPTSDTEKTIYRIWQEALHHDNFDINTDFFAAGGNSLLAVKIISHINHEFKLNLEPAAIFYYETITKQAKAINSHPISSPLIIPLTKSHELSPIICIHPIGGSIISYQKLASLLKNTHSVFGIQAPRLSNQILEPYTIFNLAELYIKEIRRELNPNAFTLLGWSAGGTIAFEMARQLQISKSPLNKLYLIDTQLIDLKTIIRNSTQEQLFIYFTEMLFASQINSGNFITNILTNIYLNKALKYSFHNIIELLEYFNISYQFHDVQIIEEAFREILVNLVSPNQSPYQLDSIVNLLIKLKLVPLSIDRKILQTYYDTFRENCLAFEVYKPHHYDGDLTYFSSTIDANNSIDTWKTLVRHIEIIYLNVKHQNLLNDNNSLKIITKYISNQDTYE